MMKNGNWRNLTTAALLAWLAGCSGSGPSDASVQHDISERAQERTHGILNADVTVLRRKVEDENRIDVWVEEVFVRTSSKPSLRDLTLMNIDPQMNGDPMFQIATLPAGTRIPGAHKSIVRYRKVGDNWVIESIRQAE